MAASPPPGLSVSSSGTSPFTSGTATITTTIPGGPTVIEVLVPSTKVLDNVIGSGTTIIVSTILPTLSSASTIASLSGTSVTSSKGASLVTPTTSQVSTSRSSSTNSATSSASTSRSANKSSNTGLIAGVAVLGALLALALGALIFVLLRKRRTKDRRGDYEPTTYEPKSVQPSPTASLENTINSLENQLHERDIQLRESQAALLQKGRGSGGSSLDDRQINERFSRLSKSINDWVLTHFKKMRPGVSPAREVVAILQKSQPNYATLLGEPRTKYLVIRSLVAEILVQAFNTEELLGNPAFSEVKQTIGAKSSITEANEWRAQTMTLLEQSPSYRSDRASAVHEISKKIDDMTSNLAGLGYSEARLNQLNQTVEAAAGLALDLAKQRALFKIIMGDPGVTEFDATTMEDVLQDHKAEILQGRPIQGIVFPAVKRWGDHSGNGYERGHTVSKAQVLV